MARATETQLVNQDVDRSLTPPGPAPQICILSAGASSEKPIHKRSPLHSSLTLPCSVGLFGYCHAQHGHGARNHRRGNIHGQDGGGRIKADHRTPGASYQDSPDLFRARQDRFPWTSPPFLGGMERALADVGAMVGDERRQQRGAEL